MLAFNPNIYKPPKANFFHEIGEKSGWLDLTLAFTKFGNLFNKDMGHITPLLVFFEAVVNRDI